MGIPAIGQEQNSNYWQLYTKQAAARQAGPNPWKPQEGSPTTAGFQAYNGGFDNLYAKFNAMDAKALGSTSAKEAGAVNPFSATQPVSQVAAVKPATPQDQTFANISRINGELSPNTQDAEHGQRMYAIG